MIFAPLTRFVAMTQFSKCLFNAEVMVAVQLEKPAELNNVETARQEQDVSTTHPAFTNVEEHWLKHIKLPLVTVTIQD
jgi:hypothetical protein